MTNRSDNNFKFSVYVNNDVIAERIFSADYFNPVVRYSVDIRDQIPTIVSGLEKALSTSPESINTNLMGYDLYSSYKTILDGVQETKFVYDGKLSKPRSVKRTFGKKTVRGVECKFGLYINENTIVERNFYVEDYNPAARFSPEINEIVTDVCQYIHNYLKDKDVNNIWEDYDLINTYGFYINQIRELSRGKRSELLNRMDDRVFVKKTKSYYWKKQNQRTEETEEA
jgi:hypothetical protein